MKEFIKPKWNSGDVEVRYQDGEVCLYANEKGIERLIKELSELQKQEGEHFHIDDIGLLTENSLSLVIANLS